MSGFLHYRWLRFRRVYGSYRTYWSFEIARPLVRRLVGRNAVAGEIGLDGDVPVAPRWVSQIDRRLRPSRRDRGSGRALGPVADGRLPNRGRP